MPAAVYISALTIIGGAATVLVLLAVVATSPLSLGPIGVTGWFIVFFLGVTAWLSLAINFLSARFNHHQGSGPRLTASLRRGLLLGGLATIWLGLSSLRQLTARDIILTIILATLVEIYFRGKA